MENHVTEGLLEAPRMGAKQGQRQKEVERTMSLLRVLLRYRLKFTAVTEHKLLLIHFHRFSKL